jgi:hypothetical protein
MMGTFHRAGLELGTYLPLRHQAATGECRFIHQDQYVYQIPRHLRVRGRRGES